MTAGASSKEVFARLGETLAEIMRPDHKGLPLQVTLIKTSDFSESYFLEHDGAKAYVKIFQDNQTARSAFSKELRALEMLQGQGVPELLFVSPGDRLICTGYIVGSVLSGLLNSDNLVEYAEKIGAWIGALANHAPGETYDRNWFEYLKNYSGTFDSKLVAQQRPILEQSRIFRLTLAHNDNAQGNFIVGPDDRLFGVDFEDCEMKPEGWDLITAARHLAQGYLAELPAISGALLRGYNTTVSERLLQDSFDQVVNVLVAANVVFDADPRA